MSGLIVDIGTGDGSFALELAKANSDSFVIGIDPNHQNLIKTSLKSYPDGSTDALDNLMFILASAEDLPSELDGMANQVFMNFPWSGLMKALFSLDQTTWQSLGRICQSGALIEVIFSYDQVRDQKLGLLVIDETFIHSTLAPSLTQLGFAFVSFDQVEQSDLKNYPSSWAKRLAYGQPRKFYHLQVRKV